MKRKIIFPVITIVIASIFSIAILKIYCGFRYYKFKDSLLDSIEFIRFRKHFLRNSSNEFEIYSNSFIKPSFKFEVSDFDILFLGGSTTELKEVSKENRIHSIVS